MKTLLLMRHAKSSWSDDYPEDFDRPLNKRGLRDAPRMGTWLASQVMTPDCIISSSARRAADTAAAVASASGYEGPIQLTRELYLAPRETYLELAACQDETVQRILMVGHNPGIESLVRHLSNEPREMPTAAIAHFELDLERWTTLRENVLCRLATYWRPADLDNL